MPRSVVLLFNPLLKVKGIHAFPKGISPKVNLIAWLELIGSLQYLSPVRYLPHHEDIASIITIIIIIICRNNKKTE